jgi:carbonic anhydrase
MTIIDRVVEANRIYARTYSPRLGKRPEPKIAVVTCMDPRLSDLPGILGLPEADIDVIRTGGANGRRITIVGVHMRAWDRAFPIALTSRRR